MKFKLFYFILFLFCSVTFFGQTDNHFCLVEHDTEQNLNFSPLNTPIYSGSIDPEYLSEFPPISFDIYFWIHRTSSGTGDYYITLEDILDNLKRVNEYFKPGGICFILKGYGYIDSNEIYSGANWYDIRTYAQNNGYKIANCMNVYLPRSLSSPGASGITNYGTDMLAVVQQSFLGHNHHRRGNVLNHELGHDFQMIHPWGNLNSSPTTEEHVTRDPNDPNYNALTKGDLIHDTPAMSGFWAEAAANNLTINDIIDPITCEYLGNNTDALGVPFSLSPIDVGNAMASTQANCIVGYTTGQLIRMREFIDQSPERPAVQAMRDENIALDLYIKDSPEDFGVEPNTDTPYVWNSSDIWVRNQPDGIEEHQNPEYDPTTPNYIYVRVTNRGCDSSNGDEELKLYWSKSCTALSWDYNWVGNNYPNNGPVIGDLVDSIQIPILQPGEQVILEFPWHVPNPSTYDSLSTQPWHFCLYTRITSNNDPMFVSETEGITQNVRNNNNIAGKNLTVIDLEPNTVGRPIGGAVSIGNIYPTIKTYNLTFRADDFEEGKKIFEEAEVTIELDNTLLNAWQRGGRKSTNIIEDKGKLIITGDNAVLEDIVLDKEELGILYLQFNFLTQEMTSKEKYIYNIIQSEASNNEVIGGETYEIRKQPRTLFYADAGNDKQIDKNEEITLSAIEINEPAIYNWYDSEGNLVYQGTDYTISAEVAKKYELEVIALSDGYKDYTDVEISLNPNEITTVSPNPSSNIVTITYKINEGNSAYISIEGFYGSNTSNNYIIDVEQGEITIDIENYPDGLYNVSLISNGVINNSKTLIKQ